VKSLSSKV
jgi:Cell division protein FtsI/penicillin-binding protein 2